MCGIFGLISENYNKKIYSYTNQLFQLSESRGKEAAGIAFWHKGNIEVLKTAESVSSLIKNRDYNNLLKKYAGKRKFCAIGHSRLVTDGKSIEHNNNQPVITENTVGVHNGIIVNHERLWKNEPHLERNATLDSEIIFKYYDLFISRHNHQLPDAVRKTYDFLEGVASTAAIFNNLNAMVLATNNGSIYSCLLPGFFLFASEKYILESFLRSNKIQGYTNIEQVKPNHARIVDIKTLKKNEISFQIDNKEKCDSTIFSTLENPQEIKDVLKNKNKISNIHNSERKKLRQSKVDEFQLLYQKTELAQRNIKRCTRCVLPETMPFIEFDDNGVCCYCKSYKKLEFQGEKKLIKDLSLNGNKEKYDCIIGISGGRDSTYALHYVKKELGLNPVAFTYDWGMVSDLARRNISRICAKLGIEHILVSADIKKKRRNIKENVVAWLKKPNLGMIPLFMAGDKQYFLYAQKLKRQMRIENIILGENMLERTNFKTGFAGVSPFFDTKHVYSLSNRKKIGLGSFYLKEYLFNPSYINRSLVDSLIAIFSYYYMNKSYLNLYNYIPWEEDEIISTLQNEYDWELAEDTASTWRIGDGTSAFYNYIYLTIAGFNEYDTFRSNQIREGIITRDQAIDFLKTDHLPRFKTIEQYLETIGIEITMDKVLSIINSSLKFYKI